MANHDREGLRAKLLELIATEENRREFFAFVSFGGFSAVQTTKTEDPAGYYARHLQNEKQAESGEDAPKFFNGKALESYKHFCIMHKAESLKDFERVADGITELGKKVKELNEVETLKKLRELGLRVEIHECQPFGDNSHLNPLKKGAGRYLLQGAGWFINPTRDTLETVKKLDGDDFDRYAECMGLG